MRFQRLRTVASCALFLGIVPATSIAGDSSGPSLAFRDVAAESGVVFRFDNGTRGLHDLLEVMGAGVGLIDADGDGRLDIYLCNGGPIEPTPGKPDPPCRLFLNRGNWHFQDVTETAGAPGPSYAMGTAVGDYDNDGRDDLLVTGWGDQRLYRNLGGGRFADVTAAAGLTWDAWSSSAAFADLDADGDLDLYILAYLHYDPAKPPVCLAPDGKRDYCEPGVFANVLSRLYRNNGDGTFTAMPADPSSSRAGKGLGILIADLVGDSRPDIYIANDSVACHLLENLGGLKFRELGVAAGVAYDGKGGVISGMGVAFGDLDNDLQPDLVVGNFFGRGTIGFRGLGNGIYQDDSVDLGLTSATRQVVGFGLAAADFDGDGDLDVLQTNGHVLDRERLVVPFAMRQTLLRNEGGKLVDASGTAGPWFARPILGRGLAVGDLDGDGRPDAVVNAINAPAAVLRNISKGGNFVTIDLVHRPPGARPAIGARLRAAVAGRTQVRDLAGGGSYMAASSRRIHLGLGRAKRLDRLEVTWPSGTVEAYGHLEERPVLRIVEGEGTAR